MSFTEEKLVHVNAYTRKDGTHVKEHYRGISSNATSSFARNRMTKIYGQPQQFRKKGKTRYRKHLIRFLNGIQAVLILTRRQILFYTVEFPQQTLISAMF